MSKITKCGITIVFITFKAEVLHFGHYRRSLRLLWRRYTGLGFVEKDTLQL